MPASLLLNDKSYRYEQIKAGDYTISSPFEERTLLFCHRWLNGENEFKQQTSGSTGTPKQIKITRAQMCISAELTISTLNLKANDIALVCVDTAYIAGKMMLVRGFEHQMNIEITEPTSNPLLTFSKPFHFAAMVPMQIENILSDESTRGLISNCKAIIVGGAPVSIKLALQIAKLKTPIYATYGMTETVSHVALQKLSLPSKDHFTTIGDVSINTNNNDQLTINGTITNNKELITNDRVNLLSPTTFKWLGRIDNVINSGGIKFQLEDVETSISLLFNDLNINYRFFVTKIEDEYLGDKIALYIEGEISFVLSNFKELLKQRLPKHQFPRALILTEKFIETGSGKIDKLATINSQS